MSFWLNVVTLPPVRGDTPLRAGVGRCATILTSSSLLAAMVRLTGGAAPLPTVTMTVPVLKSGLSATTA